MLISDISAAVVNASAEHGCGVPRQLVPGVVLVDIRELPDTVTGMYGPSKQSKL